jgi:hypothetical protein
MGENTNAYRILINLKERDQLQDLGEEGRILK